MNLEEIRPFAKMAFEKKMRDQLLWIVQKCYSHNLEYAVKDINEILGAAILFRVGPKRQLQEDEINKLVQDLTPLKVLGMWSQIREEMIFALNRVGVDPNIFNAPQ